MRKIITGIMFLLILSGPSSGQIKFERVPEFHAHDGFFLRFHVGYGSGTILREYMPDLDLKFTGLSGVFRFQIGASIAENLILFGEMGGLAITRPTLEIGSASENIEGSTVSVTDIGAGLTYYFMPSNFYICSSIVMAQNKFELQSRYSSVATKSGPGIYLSAGKEWWVSADWGLGVAGFIYTSKSSFDYMGSDDTYDVNNTAFGVVFSATYQ